MHLTTEPQNAWSKIDRIEGRNSSTTIVGDTKKAQGMIMKHRQIGLHPNLKFLYSFKEG